MKNSSYFEQYKKATEQIKEEGRRPSLLLHVCCGPCACDILTYLNAYFDITVYYTNDNIYPKEEYEHRLDEVRKYLEWYHQNYSNKIPLVVPDYQPDEYAEFILPYKELPEFSDRCWNCYRYRMKKAFAYAAENGYEYTATVMSVSRYKNARKINEIGSELEKKYPVKYLVTDFKKENGEQRSNALAKELNLYRQSYCGCASSLKEYQKRHGQ